MEKRNEILELNPEFALAFIEYSELFEEHRNYVISRQLLKSGTSVGVNMREAQNAHSRKDSIAMCVTSAMEADETEYWLLCCHRGEKYPNPPKSTPRTLSIKKLLSSSISSSIKNEKS